MLVGEQRGADEGNGQEQGEQSPGVDVESEEGEEAPEEARAEDVEPARRPPTIYQPSAAEIEEHRIDHIPYRNWCPWCVRGKSCGEQHRQRHKQRQIPIIAMDYFFITPDKRVLKREELPFAQDPDGDAALREELLEGKLLKLILIRDGWTKCMFAHVIPQKGIDQERFSLTRVVEDIMWLGHTRVILKSDNEPALLALVKESLRVLRVELDGVSQETSEEYESKSNGAVEGAIRIFRAQFRCVKECLEDRLAMKIPIKHPLVPWMVEHVALQVNTRTRCEDGLSPWAKARGRPYGKRTYCLGEECHYQLIRKGPQADARGNMAARTGMGIYLGSGLSNTEYIMGTPEGIVRSRSIQRKPLQDRWNLKAIAELRATPWSEHTRPDPTATFTEPVVREKQPEDRLPALPRSFKILDKHLQEFGYTNECQQCDWIRVNGERRMGFTHSQTCRARILAELGKTVEGQERLMQEEERINRALATRLQAEDRDESRRAMMPSSSAHELRSAPRLLVGADEAAEPKPRGLDQDQGMVPDSPGGPGGDSSLQPSADDVNMDSPAMHVESVEDPIMMCLIEELGAHGRSYRRETRKAVKNIVSEIWSPPRITRLLSRMPTSALVPGFALDLTVDDENGEPWDLDCIDKRTKARLLVKSQKPKFLILSPMCTAFCTWQALNAVRHAKDPDAIRREKMRALVHLSFAMELAREQAENGRYFLFEHPQSATSWSEDDVKEVMEMSGVGAAIAHQCQYGLQGPDDNQPIRKATRFMSNSPEILKRLSRRCHGVNGKCSRRAGGEHVHCSGRVARHAQVYTQELCREIVTGMKAQLRADGHLHDGCVGIQLVEDIEDKIPVAIEKSPANGFSGKYHDDITKQTLKDELVTEARRKELEFFTAKRVWVKRPKNDAVKHTGRRPISVRWVDINKGDDECPRYRSRLVARQLKCRDFSGESFFSPTPPLEAMRTILSLTATTIGKWKPCLDPMSEKRTQISNIDIARAYFNAKTDGEAPTYVELPAEEEGHGECVGLLKRHMYGTRRAADGWQQEYSTTLVELGFSQGLSSACVFIHPERHLATEVHGDDFLTTGPKDSQDWFESELKQRYEITVAPRLGPGPQDAKEGSILNRIIRWTGDGLELEADPRQAERLMEECGLTGANSVATPGVKPTTEQVMKDVELEPKLATPFRGAAARALYLSADRMDCQYVAKEVCRLMSKPTELGWAALKRLTRFLCGLPRMVYTYPWQTATHVEVYSDTDWSGCARTRKSTAGGVIMLGSHVIKTWSSTLGSVSLSSGEAEFYGVVKAAGMGLGYKSLLEDLGVSPPLRVWTDSSAAIGVCTRQGLGRLRHLDTHTLWVQQAVRRGRFELKKVEGVNNPADLMTKYTSTREKLNHLVRLFGCKYVDGRAENAPKLRKDTEGAKATMASVSAAGNESCNALSVEEYKEIILPHVVYAAEELNDQYPSYRAAMEAIDEDEDPDVNDQIYKKGLEIAESIVKEMRVYGRVRNIPGELQAQGESR